MKLSYKRSREEPDMVTLVALIIKSHEQVVSTSLKRVINSEFVQWREFGESDVEQTNLIEKNQRNLEQDTVIIVFKILIYCTL